MSSSSALQTTPLIDAVASEMASRIDVAVECWMAEIERALRSLELTSLGRLHAVHEILENYKRLTGKTELEGRRA
jgi:hypothetical protein